MSPSWPPMARTMVQSELYTSKASAKNCVTSCMKNMPEAEVVDET